MAPDINNPGGVKNSSDEIRDGVVSDSTRFPGGFIDQAVSSAGAALTSVGQFNLDNASRVQVKDISAQTNDLQSVSFGDGGTKMYVLEAQGDSILEYDLSTGFDVSTASFSGSFSIQFLEDQPSGIAVATTGTDAYLTGDQKGQIRQLEFSTAFDISTMSATPNSPFISSQDGDPSGLAIGPNGDRIYLSGRANANVYQYSLSTSFDVSTLSFTQSFSVGAQDSTPKAVRFSQDGGLMYVSGSQNTNIYQYRLSTSFDISTASFVRALDVSPNVGNPTGVDISPKGSRLYVAERGGPKVHEYAVDTVVGDVE